jgi:hypothetical protein
MEILQALIAAPLTTLFFFLGTILLLMALLGKLEKPVNFHLAHTPRIIAGVLGLVMLAVGFIGDFTKSGPPDDVDPGLVANLPDADTTPTPMTPGGPEPTVEEPTPGPLNPDAPTPGPPTPDAPVIAPTLEASPSPSPTMAPFLIENRCFRFDLWQLSTGRMAQPIVQAGCWNLGPWGWVASDGGFSILVNKSNVRDTYGIYTPVSANAEITFSLQIDEIRTQGNNTASLVLGIVDASSPSQGAFLMLTETSNVTLAQIQTGNSQRNRQNLEQYFQYGAPSNIRLVLNGTQLSIFINDYQTPDQTVIVNQPAFWIGTQLNNGSDMTLTVGELLLVEK